MQVMTIITGVMMLTYFIRRIMFYERANCKFMIDLLLYIASNGLMTINGFFLMSILRAILELGI